MVFKYVLVIYGDGNNDDDDGDDDDDDDDDVDIMNCFCGMVGQKKVLIIPSCHLPTQS